MFMNKRDLEFFTENFFQVVSELFESHVNSEGKSLDVDLIKNIRREREKLLKEYNINSGDENVQSLLSSIIKEDHESFLKKHDIDDNDKFVKSFMLGIADLEEKEQKKFIKCVSDYEDSQELSSLYYFGHILEDSSDVHQFTASFKSITNNLAKSQKAEILGAMSVFIENFMEENKGKKFIESTKNYSDKPERWFEQLIEKMYERSALGLSIVYDPHDKSIKMKTQDSGIFDAQYFIKRSENDVGSIQVSATSSLTSAFESDSVVRHALTNALTSHFLNEYIEMLAGIEVSKERDRLYEAVEKEKQRIKNGGELLANEVYDPNNPDVIEKNMEQHLEIVRDRFKKDFVDSVFESLSYTSKINPKDGAIDSMTFHNASLEDLMLKSIIYGSSKNYESLESAIKDISKDPTLHIGFVFDLDEDEPITQEHIDRLMGKSSEKKNQRIVTPSAYFSSFHPTVSIKDKYKNAPIVKEVFEKNVINAESFRSQNQFLGLLNFPTSDLETHHRYLNNVWENILKNEIKNRAQSNNDKISNNKYSNIDLKKFESIVFEQFFLQTPDNIEKNQLALDKGGARKNINDYIESFIINVKNEEQFKDKIRDIGIKTELSYEEVLNNMKNALYAKHGLKSRIEDKYLYIRSDRERIESEQKRIESEQKMIELENALLDSNLERLNTALELGVGEVLFRNNKELLKLYKYFDKNDYDGLERKVFSEDYSEALVEVVSENKKNTQEKK